MRWSVTYWHGPGDLTVVDDTQLAWNELPRDGVAWVDVTQGEFRQTLGGRDYFWLAPGGRFGMFNDPDNLAWYGGDPAAQSEAWAWSGSGFAVANPSVPADAHVIAGVLIPDEEWERLRGH